MQRRSRWCMLLGGALNVALAACSGPQPGTGGGGGSGGSAGGPPLICSNDPPAGFCVLAKLEDADSGIGQYVLRPGDKLKLSVIPACASSTCVVSDYSACTISGRESFKVEGKFCLRNRFPVCSPDCNGRGSVAATCESEAVLTPGEHTVTLGNKSITIPVPSTFPSNGPNPFCVVPGP
jgi:hypothetical protein